MTPVPILRRFGTRLLLWLLVVSASASFWVGTQYYRHQLRFLRQKTTERGRTLTTALAARSEVSVYASDRTSLTTILAQVSRGDDIVSLTLYDRQGDIIARSVKTHRAEIPSGPSAAVVQAAQLPLGEVIEQRSGRYSDFFSPILSTTNDSEMTLLGGSARHTNALEAIGIAHIRLAPDPASKELNTVIHTGIRAASIVLLLGVALALLISTRVSRPILALVRGTQKIGEGALGVQIQIERNDEFGLLAGTFNEMSTTIHRTVASLASLNQNLEEKVSERTAALEEKNNLLLRQRDQLRELSKVKSQFLANISHELRTPLSAVIGYAELLADGTCGDVNEEQIGALRGIADSGNHLLNLVNNLLDLAKADAGQMIPHWDNIDISKIILDVIELTKPLAHANKITLKTKQLPQSLPCHSDGGWIRQILVNLISNAIKFTENGGVTIDTSCDQQTIQIAVEDTGSGISSSDLAVIFEPFRQVDGSSTRQHGGTGLGLSISKQLAELLGGHLTVSSTPGAGSRFTLTIPKQRIQDSAPNLPLSTPSCS